MRFGGARVTLVRGSTCNSDAPKTLIPCDKDIEILIITIVNENINSRLYAGFKHYSKLL